MIYTHFINKSRYSPLTRLWWIAWEFPFPPLSLWPLCQPTWLYFAAFAWQTKATTGEVLSAPIPGAMKSTEVWPWQPWQGPTVNRGSWGFLHARFSSWGAPIFSRRSANWQKTVIQEREFHEEKHSFPDRGRGVWRTWGSCRNSYIIKAEKQGPVAETHGRERNWGDGPALTDTKLGCCAGTLMGASSLGLTFHPQGVMHKIRRYVHKRDKGRACGWAHNQRHTGT